MGEGWEQRDYLMMSQESRNAGTLRDSEVTESTIGAAIAVHRELQPGFLESIYEQALAVELAVPIFLLS
jgi:PD-(D/E)XK nuclease superfamily protein